MKYFILTNNDLSEPFDTEEQAQIKMNKLHSKKKSKSKIIKLPDIKDGLKLFRNDKYYRTIIGHTNDCWLTQIDLDNKHELTDLVRKETMLKWFVNGLLDIREEYNTNFKFHIYEDKTQDIPNFNEDE